MNSSRAPLPPPPPPPPPPLRRRRDDFPCPSPPRACASGVSNIPSRPGFVLRRLEGSCRSLMYRPSCRRRLSNWWTRFWMPSAPIPPPMCRPRLLSGRPVISFFYAWRDSPPPSASPPPAALSLSLPLPPFPAAVSPPDQLVYRLYGLGAEEMRVGPRGAEAGAQLNQHDLAPLPSDGVTPRWQNTAQWARNALREGGYLRSDSPHGIWEPFPLAVLTRLPQSASTLGIRGGRGWRNAENA